MVLRGSFLVAASLFLALGCAQATDLSALADLELQPPVTVTFANKSLPPPLSLPVDVLPSKNATLQAIARGAADVVSSPNPLNETKVLAQELIKYKQETIAAAKGSAGIVTYASAVQNPTSYGSDVFCYWNNSTGQALGILQAGAAQVCGAATPGASRVVIPTSRNYISQIRIAYMLDSKTIGRITFQLRANASAKPVSYRCGTAGGASVALLPNDRSFLVSQIVVTGCAAGVQNPRATTLPTVTLPGRRRDLLQLPGSGSGSAPIAMAAGKFNVTAVPIANLPIDAATGLPKTPPLGNIVSAGGPAFPNANWMGQMASVLGKKTISNVVLPGTHDSGTSGIDTFYTYAEKAQVNNLGEQLTDGIRYLDLRITEAEHDGCAEPSNFNFVHGDLSYRVEEGLQQIYDFLQVRGREKEIIILDFQEFVEIYGDKRPAGVYGVLIKSLIDKLGHWIIPSNSSLPGSRGNAGFPTVLGPNAVTLEALWNYNANFNETRQVIVLFENNPLIAGQNCSSFFNPGWFYVREDYIVSEYKANAYTDELKEDIEVQLSRNAANNRVRIGDYDDFHRKEVEKKLRVLQLVARPSNSWYFYSSSDAPNLLEYGTYVNDGFNQCGWFGQQLWASQTYNSTWGTPSSPGGQRSTPNIIIVDNYLGSSLGYLQVRPPAEWVSVAWSGGKWSVTDRTINYVDFVKNLNLISPAAVDPDITEYATVDCEDD